MFARVIDPLYTLFTQLHNTGRHTHVSRGENNVANSRTADVLTDGVRVVTPHEHLYLCLLIVPQFKE
jgi:hypothetical protein